MAEETRSGGVKNSADPDALSDYYQHCKLAKPEPRKRIQGREKRAQRDKTTEIRIYVFARERDLCRCCRIHPAESMNEEPPRSCGGKISKRDSMAVCGDGVRRCHGFITRNEILIERGPFGAEDVLWFTPKTQAAADWMRIAVGYRLESAPMRAVEADV